MEVGQLVVGLDIGASKITAAVGETHADGDIKILGFYEKPILPSDEALRNGEIENSKRTTELIDEVLEELSIQLNLNLESVTVNFSSPDISGHFHKGNVTKSGDNKQIQQTDVDKLVSDVRKSFRSQPGRTVLHCIPQDFFVNDIKAGEKVVGKFGVQIGGEFYFLTSKSESLSNYYYTLQNVKVKIGKLTDKKIQIDSLILSPIADSLAILDHSIDDKRNGVAIVNLGAEITEIGIFHKNSLRFFKAIPLAGNQITSDLMKAFGLSFEEAEVLKKIAGNIPSASISGTEVAIIDRKKDLAPLEISLKSANQVVEWRLKEIAGIIKAEISRSGFEGLLTNGLILTGGSSSMIIIKDIFVDITKIKSVRKTRYSTKIDFNGHSSLNKPRYSTLLGLLLVSNNSFDGRIGNNILKHSPLPEIPSNVPEAETTPVKEPKKTGTFVDFIKKIIKDENTDDTY